MRRSRFYIDPGLGSVSVDNRHWFYRREGKAVLYTHGNNLDHHYLTSTDGESDESARGLGIKDLGKLRDHARSLGGHPRYHNLETTT